MKPENRTPNTCRVCRQPLHEFHLISFPGMPASAQHLPSNRAAALKASTTLEIRQCSGCGLVQSTGDPVPYYREVIRAVGISPAMERFRKQQFDSFIKKFNLTNAKALEVGSGHGEYLRIIGTCGVDAYGIEFSKSASDSCQKAGLKVFQGFIDDQKYTLPEAPFAAFFMFNFLEHIPHPNATLAGIANNLTQNGVGIIEVPNLDMIIRKNLFTEFITDHIFYFTRETLTTVLAINGFELLECKPVWHDYILSASVKKRRPLNFDQLTETKQRLTKELHNFLSRFPPGTVTAWGAGHQALTSIMMFDLKDKFPFIVDSAPFKQGHYSPASGIKIVSPEALNDPRIKAILITAASYSDEIIDTITKNFGKRFKLAVLRDNRLEIL